MRPDQLRTKTIIVYKSKKSAKKSGETEPTTTIVTTTLTGIFGMARP